MNDPLINGVYQPYSPQAINRGYFSPLQQWYETNFDPTSGYTNRAEYKGQDWTAMQTLANYFTALGISVNLKNEQGISTLTLNDATGNYVIDKWELSVDREQPEMFENPLFLELISSCNEPWTVVTMMKNVLKSSDNGDGTQDLGWFQLARPQTKIVTFDDSGTPTTTTTNNPIAYKFLDALGAAFYGTYADNGLWPSSNMRKLKQYVDMYNQGVTNFLRGKYRLRHTSNIPANWNVSVADFNVERIYTISQLIGECTGSGFIYPLPNYLSYKILNFVPDPVAAWISYYIWGALKEKSDAQTVVNNRVEITTEYLIDNINTNLYSPI